MQDDSAHRQWDEAERLLALRSLRILDTQSEPAFDRIIALAQRLFDVPIALVSLVDEHRQWFKARCGLAASETERSVSFCAHALNRQDALLVVPDARRDARFSDNRLVTGPPHVRYYAGAVLRAPNGAPVGTVCVIDTEPRDGLDDEDGALLHALADLAADELELRETKLELEARVSDIDLANAKLRDVLAIHQADLEHAALSQRLILPRSHIDLHGVTASAVLLPSRVVSGDAYSYGQLTPTTNYFWVADVAGHGVAAALLAATLSRVITGELLLESESQSPRPPGEVLDRLNRRLALWDHDDSYFTMIYGIADGQGRVSLAIAGHPPPIICEPGAVAEIKSASGTPIGLFEEIDVETIDLEMARGARLLLYSDGIVEAENSAFEPFGDRRLQDWVFETQNQPAQAALAHLEARLRGWVGPTDGAESGLSDDATAVLLEFTGTATGA